MAYLYKGKIKLSQVLKIVRQFKSLPRKTDGKINFQHTKWNKIGYAQERGALKVTAAHTLFSAE